MVRKVIYRFTSTNNFTIEELIQLLTSKLASLVQRSGTESTQLQKATEYLQLAVDKIQTEVSFTFHAFNSKSMFFCQVNFS